MNTPINNKEEIFPEDSTEDDKLNFDILLNQSKQLSPKLAKDEWVLRMGILAYMKKEKQGDSEPPSQEEISSIRNQYTKDTIFYTEPIEPIEPIETTE